MSCGPSCVNSRSTPARGSPVRASTTTPSTPEPRWSTTVPRERDCPGEIAISASVSSRVPSAWNPGAGISPGPATRGRRRPGRFASPGFQNGCARPRWPFRPRRALARTDAAARRPGRPGPVRPVRARPGAALAGAAAARCHGPRAEARRGHSQVRRQGGDGDPERTLGRARGRRAAPRRKQTPWRPVGPTDRGRRFAPTGPGRAWSSASRAAEPAVTFCFRLRNPGTSMSRSTLWSPSPVSVNSPVLEMSAQRFQVSGRSKPWTCSDHDAQAFPPAERRRLAEAELCAASSGPGREPPENLPAEVSALAATGRNPGSVHHEPQPVSAAAGETAALPRCRSLHPPAAAASRSAGSAASPGITPSTTLAPATGRPSGSVTRMDCAPEGRASANARAPGRSPSLIRTAGSGSPPRSRRSRCGETPRP